MPPKGYKSLTITIELFNDLKKGRKENGFTSLREYLEVIYYGQNKGLPSKK
jgi:hypothetical protein